MQKGSTEQEIMEAIWVAAEMRAGAVYVHSILATDAMNGVASHSSRHAECEPPVIFRPARRSRSRRLACRRR
jgi:hypothetical protein